MPYLKIFALTASLISNFAFAHSLSINQPLPSVTVKKLGELTYNGDKFSYQDWTSQSLTGKMRVIFAIAGRSSAKESITPMINAITAAQFPKDKYQTTTIVNLDDSVWGTSPFVKSSAKNTKKEFMFSSFVLDDNSTVSTAWDLKEAGAAMIVVDSENKVLFVKEDKISNKEIAYVIDMIRSKVK